MFLHAILKGISRPIEVKDLRTDKTPLNHSKSSISGEHAKGSPSRMQFFPQCEPSQSEQFVSCDETPVLPLGTAKRSLVFSSDNSASSLPSSSSSLSSSSSCSPSSLPTPLPGMQTAEGREPSSEEEKLRRKLSASRKQCERLRKKLSRAKQSRPTTAAEVVKLAANYLSPSAHRLFSAQINMYAKSKKGRRWTKEMKDFALSVYFHSPRSYRFLRKVLYLPSLATLTRYKSLIPLNTGVHSHVVEFLKQEVPKWPIEKRLCTLVFDEVSIKRSLSYDVKQDKVVGLVDGGFSRKNVIADQALIAMIKGTVSNWKQVLGHWFTAGGEGADGIEAALHQCLDQLSQAGLIVTMIICDQGAKNRSVIKRLGISHEKPYFLHNNEKIFFMWDAPHLIKSIRNNLMKYICKWKNGVANWKHIVQAVINEDPLRFRLLPKVQLKHVKFKNSFRKMKVKLATQVLSRTMSTALMVLQIKGIVPVDALHTADFVQDMNDLFDCFNSSKRFDKLTFRHAFSKSSRHEPFLRDMLRHLSEVQFLGCPRQPDCVRGWILNIRSLLMFSEHMLSNYGVKELRTRLLNQDCLENTFSIIRQQHGWADHPTATQCESGLKSLSLSSMSKLPTSSNCEDNELEKALVHISKLKVASGPCSYEESQQEEWPEGEQLPSGSVEENAFHYCAGFIIKKFLSSHKCDHCKKQLLVQKDARILTQDYQLFTYFKAFSDAVGAEFGNLCLPSEHVFKIFHEMESIFFNIFHAAAHRAGILRIIMDGYALKNLCMNLCCQASELNLQRLYAKTRILWEVKSLNRKLADPVADKRTSIKKLYKIL